MTRQPLIGNRVGAHNPVVIRQGASFARGVLIDGFLSYNDVVILYERWKESWPEPEQHRGDEEAITCEMILEVPEEELKKVYGKLRAGRLLEVARRRAEV